MIELSQKYVFHIPLYKYDDENLVLIDIDDILDDLIGQFNQNGFESLYMTKVRSLYKSRMYDEILITIFSSSHSPVEIFRQWFVSNNTVLCQEAFAYEMGNQMIIIRL